MMAQIGHVIKKVRVSEVRKITMDNAAAKNIALSKDKSLSHGI
jgi:hypothetical protein